MRRVSGAVLQLSCQDCQHTFPVFQFAGDTDLATDGLCAATAHRRNEIVIAETTDEEWNELASGSTTAIEARIRAALKRNDLHVPRFLGTGEPSPAKRGVSFRDFQEQRQPAKPIYSCLRCTDGEAVLIGEQTPAEFRRAGGSISTVGDLALS